MKKEQDSELKKNSALSQIESKNLTNTQIKIFNFLLNAALAAKTEDINTSTFCIETQKLLNDANISLNSINLKKAIKGMMDIKVDTDILGKSTKKGEKGWSVFSLISGAEFNNGLLTFSFPHQIVNNLINPKLYSIINLRSVSNLKSKAANVIYTLAKDYGKCTNGTPKLTIEHLDALIGVGQYDMRTFVSKILKKAVKEINEKTELEIEMEIIKYSRKIHAVKFIVIKDIDDDKKKKKKKEKEVLEAKVVKEEKEAKETQVATKELAKTEVVEAEVVEIDDKKAVVKKEGKKEDKKKIPDDVMKAINKICENKTDGYKSKIINNYIDEDPGTIYIIENTLQKIQDEERYDRYRSKVGVKFLVNGIYDYKVVSMYYDKENDIYRYIIENIETHSRLDKPADDIYPHI